MYVSTHAPLNLPIRTSVQELEDACRSARVPLKGGHKDGYAVDDHFAVHVLSSINTLEDALAFIEQLNKDREQVDPGYQCQRVSGIRHYLEDAFWRKDADRLRTAIASNRRTCCSCHELGSYKVRDDRVIYR